MQVVIKYYADEDDLMTKIPESELADQYSCCWDTDDEPPLPSYPDCWDQDQEAFDVLMAAAQGRRASKQSV